ncbi:hypothetical protein [Schlesneria sp.]|uniref:hypothetical protein n=1 Tax=Schlesneria sp. TaxID=2762018 RepID=UPI002F0485CD
MRTILICSVLVWSWGTCGCRDSARHLVEQDPELARQTLETVLQAWKDGKTGTLAKRNPPIRFVDDDLLAGNQLLGFELEDESIPIIPYQTVRVELELRTPQGEAVSKTVQYQVGIDPGLTVLRGDD